jgi:hypothetical protein
VRGPRAPHSTVSVHEGAVPISSSIRNAWIDFSAMDCSIVAIVSDVVRDGEAVVGYGFNSNGRYSAGEILRRRVLPRLLDGLPRAHQAWSSSPRRCTRIRFVEPDVPGGEPATMTTVSPALNRPIDRIALSTWRTIASVEVT